MSDAAKNPHLNARADAKKAKIDAMLAAWEAYTGVGATEGELSPTPADVGDDIMAAPVTPGRQRIRKAGADG